jgi:hypothetical protein
MSDVERICGADHPPPSSDLQLWIMYEPDLAAAKLRIYRFSCHYMPG